MIVITAPTGNIGRRLMPLLLDAAPDRGEELRVIVRDPARLPDTVRERVEVVPGSHGDPAGVGRGGGRGAGGLWRVPPAAAPPPAAPPSPAGGWPTPTARIPPAAPRLRTAGEQIAQAHLRHLNP
ncbi:hypothetical protein ACFXA8_37540, partial [Streptomyces sp. NPDC059409]